MVARHLEAREVRTAFHEFGTHRDIRGQTVVYGESRRLLVAKWFFEHPRFEGCFRRDRRETIVHCADLRYAAAGQGNALSHLYGVRGRCGGMLAWRNVSPLSANIPKKYV